MIRLTLWRWFTGLATRTKLVVVAVALLAALGIAWRVSVVRAYDRGYETAARAMATASDSLVGAANLRAAEAVAALRAARARVDTQWVKVKASGHSVQVASINVDSARQHLSEDARRDSSVRAFDATVRVLQDSARVFVVRVTALQDTVAAERRAAQRLDAERQAVIVALSQRVAAGDALLRAEQKRRKLTVKSAALIATVGVVVWEGGKWVVRRYVRKR